MTLHKNIFRGQSRRYGEKVNMASEKQPGIWNQGTLCMGSGDFSIIYRPRDERDGRGFRGVMVKTPVYSETVGQFIGIWDDTCWAELSAEEQTATTETEWQGKPIFEDDIVIVCHGDKQEKGIVCWNPQYLWFEIRLLDKETISFKRLYAAKQKEGRAVQIKVVESCYDSDQYENFKALRTKSSIRNEFRAWYNHHTEQYPEPHWVYGGVQEIHEITGATMYGSHVWANYSQGNSFSIEKEDLQSLGQWTGMFDDFHEPAPDNMQVGKPIFEDDYIFVEWGKNVHSGSVRYFSEVAAFGIRDSVENVNLLFATILHARAEGQTVRIDNHGPQHALRRMMQKHP